MCDAVGLLLKALFLGGVSCTIFFDSVDRRENRKRRNAAPGPQHEEEDISGSVRNGRFKTTAGGGAK